MMKMQEALLLEAEAALKWSSEGEFSARITPIQAAAVLEELAALRARASGPTSFSREFGTAGTLQVPSDQEADLAIHPSAYLPRAGSDGSNSE